MASRKKIKQILKSLPEVYYEVFSSSFVFLSVACFLGLFIVVFNDYAKSQMRTSSSFVLELKEQQEKNVQISEIASRLVILTSNNSKLASEVDSLQAQIAVDTLMSKMSAPAPEAATPAVSPGVAKIAAQKPSPGNIKAIDAEAKAAEASEAASNKKLSADKKLTELRTVQEKSVEDLTREIQNFVKLSDAANKAGDKISNILGPKSEINYNHTGAMMLSSTKTQTQLLEYINAIGELKSNVVKINDLLSRAQSEQLVELMKNSRDKIAIMDKQLDEMVKVVQEVSSKRDSIFGTLINTSIIAMIIFIIIFAVYLIVKIIAANENLIRTEKDMQSILDSVQEGLFLLSKDGSVGAKYSKATTAIMGVKFRDGINFYDAIYNKVSSDTMRVLKKYLELLFNNKVKEKLISTLNPIQTMEILASKPGKDGSGEKKYLSINFSRIKDERSLEEDRLLVSVVDKTHQIKLEQKLKVQEEQKKEEFDIFSNLLNVNVADFNGFLERLGSECDNINLSLKEIRPEELSGEDGSKVANMLLQWSRVLHGLKGEAGVFQLKKMVQLLHKLEDKVVELKSKTSWSGEEFISIMLMLDNIFSYSKEVSVVIDKIKAFQPNKPDSLSSSQLDIDFSESEASRVILLEDKLKNAISSVASKEHKQVMSIIDLKALRETPAQGILKKAGFLDMLGAVSIQLVKNSVIHGIEPIEGRAAARKGMTGSIIVFARIEGSNLNIRFKDDGAGIDKVAVLTKAWDMGIIDEEKSNTLTDAENINLIFQSGLSTAKTLSEDAGRGFGLDMVSTIVKNAGGSVTVASQKNVGTNFVLSFSLIEKSAE